MTTLRTAPPSTPTAPAAPAQPTTRRRRRNTGWRQGRIRRLLVVTHRWTALVLGVVLIAITTSGALVLYQPEWQRWSHPGVYEATPSSEPLGMVAAFDAVAAAHPDFEAGTVTAFHGVYEVMSTDGDAHPGFYVVDPGSGEIRGPIGNQHGVMPFLVNLHECALSCEGYTGYVPFLAKKVPGLSSIELIDGFTWSSLVLSVAGIMLFFLAVGGLVLWWPGVRRMAHGFRLRWRQSRFTRDFDLHQLAGLVAVPFLLMWAITDTSFEIPLDKPWYALTGGVTPPEDQYDFASNDPPAGAEPRDIGMQAAIDAVDSQVSWPVVWVSAPAEEGTAGYYEVWQSAGVDPYRFSEYPGQDLFYVDRYDASHLKRASGDSPTLSNFLWDEWRQGGLHYGFAVNGWWRLIWFAFGLSPLLLAFTGVSTWLFRRGVRKRKRLAKQARAHAVAVGETLTRSETQLVEAVEHDLAEIAETDGVDPDPDHDPEGELATSRAGG